MMEKILANIVVFLMRCAGRLPLGFHYACGRLVSGMMLHVFHYRKDVVMTNLARSFPEKKYGELKKLCSDFYAHLGDIMAETVRFAGCSDSGRLRRQDLCRFTPCDEFNRAYTESKGMVILTSHCGNWELYGGWLSYMDPDAEIPYGVENVNVVYKKLSSKVMDLVFAKTRTAPAGKDYKGYLESRSVLRHAVEHRGEKMIYVFPTDQAPYKGAGKHEVPEFMHQKTYTMTGGASLASRLGLGVAFLRFDSESRGHYRISLTPICSDASCMTAEEIMSRYYELLQEEIQAQPWNYLWSHKRWK